MSGKAVGRNAILPFRPRQLPEIDTIWVDVSTILCIPPGFMSGIPRTIRKLLDCLSSESWTNIRLCVVVPDIGLAEVHPNCIEEHDSPINPIPAPVAPPQATRRRHSRFWYIPWAVRHRFRTAETGVRNLWVDPNAASQASLNVPALPHYPPYRHGSIIGLPELGPRDLVVSFGGMWVVPNGSDTFARAHQKQQFKHVSLIYDLIPINAPHLFQSDVSAPFKVATNMQLNESDVILTISEFSKQEILQYAKDQFKPVGSVEVFTLGSDIKPLNAIERAATPTQHRRPFVLTVGTVEWRKNHFGMYQAWRKLVKKLGPDKAPDLVMAGKPGWNSEVIVQMIRNDPLIKEKIILKPHVDDRELDWLYKNCLFTLYPSTFEGWGLPVEESFIYGKMCVTTNATSLPEVGGEFADYVEEDDVDGIVRGVMLGLDEDYRRTREEFIFEYYKPNTWQMASAQIQSILKSHFQFDEQPVRESIWRRAGTKASRKMASALSLFW